MSKNKNFTRDFQGISDKNAEPSLFRLSDFKKKQVELSFSQEQVSNDGGLLLLNEVDNRIGLIKELANCINDERHSSYIKHSVFSMLRQRIFQISAGYEDANDCDLLKTTVF